MTLKTERLRVALDARGYDIIVGEELRYSVAEHILPLLPSKRVIVVTDRTVAEYYAGGLLEALTDEGVEAHCVTVMPGEGSKSFEVLEGLVEKILALTPDRKTTLIALGGGVVGDLTGFLASILLRGVPFIQIPTTLLSQVDSSVGGKTAINTSAGKNLIGSFYQPKLVIADLDTLETLPEREMRAGYGEILKYGLIMDPAFYEWCLANADALIEGDMKAQQYAVLACCRMKAEIVAADERENDMRALLNLGHTFGHALEAETGMSDILLHGEAVAIGMVMACRLSEKMGLIKAEVEHQLVAHLRAVGLPALPSDIDHPWTVDGITSHFAGDKKAEHGTLTFIVLDGIGKARVAKAVDADLVRSVVASYF